MIPASKALNPDLSASSLNLKVLQVSQKKTELSVFICVDPGLRTRLRPDKLG